VKLFGPLELERDGAPLPRFASRKSGELLAYLALNRRSAHTREQLAGLVWGDSTDERARHTLNTTLWRINRVLESAAESAGERGYLRITPQQIGFNAASGIWLDVAEFESRCDLAERANTDAQRAALYTQAIAFYRGDLLPDCYEDWCVVERERLQAMYVRALARLLTFNSANAELDLAIDYGRRILSCDPLREEVHRDLIRLHLDADQPAAALRQYRQCEDLLRDELGVDPAPETRALVMPALGKSPRPRPPAHDFAALESRVAELSAACETARSQLQDAMHLVGQLTAELQAARPRPIAVRPVARAAAGW
jgi:DNA-binding SARP family transcriptional activator